MIWINRGDHEHCLTHTPAAMTNASYWSEIIIQIFQTSSVLLFANVSRFGLEKHTMFYARERSYRTRKIINKNHSTQWHILKNSISVWFGLSVWIQVAECFGCWMSSFGRKMNNNENEEKGKKKTKIKSESQQHTMCRRHQSNRITKSPIIRVKCTICFGSESRILFYDVTNEKSKLPYLVPFLKMPFYHNSLFLVVLRYPKFIMSICNTTVATWKNFLYSLLHKNVCDGNEDNNRSLCLQKWFWKCVFYCHFDMNGPESLRHPE